MGRHLLPGNVLAGKFRVERVIGEGGMGTVLAAHHLQLDQRVALKVMRPDAGLGADGVQRFLREAQAVAKLRSEHVVRVLDVGALPDGAPYIVMEYLEGHDLAAHVHKRGRLSVEETIDFVVQACDALAEAHRLGIVHRDLKPANLFLSKDADGSAVIKILDFGISKQTFQDGRHDLTSTAGVVGSPSYMSPEQLKASRDVDGRTDIWALGIVLHELLTGRLAFEATTLAELHVAILSQPPVALRAVRHDVPPALEAVLLRCLEKDVRNRYQSVVELVSALYDFAPPSARARIERMQRIAGVAPRSGEQSSLTPSKSSPVGVHSTHGTTGQPPSQQGFHTPPPMSAPPGYASPNPHGISSVPSSQPMSAPPAYAQTGYPGLQPYGMTGADITGYQPGPLQQTYGGGYGPMAPPPHRGPNVVLILIVAALVIALVAGMLVCGVCAAGGA